MLDIHILLCIKWSFFPEYNTFLVPVTVFFTRSRLRSMQGARLYTTVQVWVPARLHGACSRLSKSRDLASNHGSLSAELEPS